MRLRSLSVSMLITTLMTAGLLASAAYCATKPAISQSKQGAEARGQIFIANRDEIVNKARMEGKLRVITGSGQISKDHK